MKNLTINEKINQRGNLQISNHFETIFIERPIVIFNSTHLYKFRSDIYLYNIKRIFN